MATQLITTCSSFLGGKAAVVALPQKTRLTFGGSWVTGDKYSVVVLDPATSSNETFGAGTVTGEQPSFCLALKRKVNVLAGDEWYYSAVDNAMEFNNPQGLGNSNINVADNFAESEDLQAIVPYQGMVAVYSRGSVQIWEVGAGLDDYAQRQVLAGVGTYAPDSVKAFGELDSYSLHDTGIRSLRVRDSSNNAFSADIGSPVDFLVQAKLQESSAAQRVAACGVVEPSTGQYWLFLKDVLYVLSNIPGAKITAWGTWDCSYQTTSGVGVIIRNGDASTIQVRMSELDNVDTASAPVSLAFLASVTSTKPIKYIWVYDAAGTTLIEQVIIPDGLSFAGEVYYVPGFTLFTAKQTAFVPEKFVTHQGQVYVSSSNAFYLYGGAEGTTYDNTICAWELPWMDGDTPAIDKGFEGVDCAQVGSWHHFGGTDFRSGELVQVVDATDVATFAGGKIGWTSKGTHVKYRMQTTGLAEKSTVSNLQIHYTGNKSK